MRLSDLDPRWLVAESGRRIGFIFISPVNALWKQTCFFQPTYHAQQIEAVTRAYGARRFDWQACNVVMAWGCSPAPELATFEIITVLPSIDGSRGGLWHGNITEGEIVGGLP